VSRLTHLTLASRLVWPLLLLLILAGCSARGNSTGVAAGRVDYEANCAKCHGDAATGEGALPDTPVHGPEGHTWHHADGQLSEIILGTLNIPDRTMPSFEGILTEAEVMGILDYMKTGWYQGQIEQQREVSANWEALYPEK
jgi:mono/diheme cytochrome c family protein